MKIFIKIFQISMAHVIQGLIKYSRMSALCKLHLPYEIPSTFLTFELCSGDERAREHFNIWFNLQLLDFERMRKRPPSSRSSTRYLLELCGCDIVRESVIKNDQTKIFCQTALSTKLGKDRFETNATWRGCVFWSFK